MKKVLITGMSGFVGTHLANYLSSNQDIQLFGTSFSDIPTGLAQIATLEKINLQDAQVVENLIAKVMPDEIYHLAALSSPSASFENPAETFNNNVDAEINLLEAVRKKSPNSKVLIISSADIYGSVGESELPIDENAPLRPVTPYAVSKIAQDFLGLQYFLAHNLNIIRVRPFNHTGPGQSDVFVIPSFAKQIAKIEKNQQESIIKVGNLSAKRDFTDVRDMVHAYVMAMEKGKAGDVYNIGSDTSVTIQSILDSLVKLSNAKVTVEIDQDKVKPSTQELRCDSTKFKTLTGWQPKISLEQTLKDTLDYWRKIS